MSDREVLKQLLNKYGRDGVENMMNDLLNREFKYETGTHSIRSKRYKGLFIIQHKGYDWQDFVKMWNKISNATRNKIYIPNDNIEYIKSYIKGNKWYVLKSTEDLNYPYVIVIESEIE